MLQTSPPLADNQINGRIQALSIKVLVVDDTPHVRDMLADLLRLDGFEVVGRAGSGAEAIELTETTGPDVVVMDYAMAGMNGLEATRKIREAVPKQSVILYTAFPDEPLKKAAEEAGAALVLGKTEGVETLERTIAELCARMRIK